MVANHSFGELPFVGGEDDAQDAWRDKWEAHARRSFDEARRRSSVDDGGAASGEDSADHADRLPAIFEHRRDDMIVSV